MANPLLRNRQYGILKIVFIYALFGLLWIYTSDTVLGWFVNDHRIIVQIAIFKGSVFIILTSLLLYFLIKQYDQKTATSEVVKSAKEDVRWRRCSPKELLLVIKISTIWRSILVSQIFAETFKIGGI